MAEAGGGMDEAAIKALLRRLQAEPENKYVMLRVLALVFDFVIRRWLVSVFFCCCLCPLPSCSVAHTPSSGAVSRHAPDTRAHFF